MPDTKIVLIVEDEPILRMNATDFLGAAGFSTIEAANAPEAIAILERPLDIRFVFTDIDMPEGVDGLKLAALIRDRWPPIEIVVTSGYTKPDLHRLPARSVFIPKPYSPQSIIAALQNFAG